MRQAYPPSRSRTTVGAWNRPGIPSDTRIQASLCDVPQTRAGRADTVSLGGENEVRIDADRARRRLTNPALFGCDRFQRVRHCRIGTALPFAGPSAYRVSATTDAETSRPVCSASTTAPKTLAS